MAWFLLTSIMQVCNGNEQQKEQTEIKHGQFGEEKAGRSTKFVCRQDIYWKEEVIGKIISTINR